MMKNVKRLWPIIGVLFIAGCLPTNIPPTANFVANPSRGSAPLTVVFDASSSSDPDGEIVSYSWDFGDGSTDVGITTTHTYVKPGTYTAKLTVTDDQGSKDIEMQTIQVSEPDVYGIGDTASNGYVSITLREVRSAKSVGIWKSDPGRLFLVVNLKVVALKDNQYVSKFNFKVIHSDGRVQDSPDIATYSLEHPFEDAELDTGQWTEGEIVFEVYPSQFYILEWEELFGESIKFKFSL